MRDRLNAKPAPNLKQRETDIERRLSKELRTRRTFVWYDIERDAADVSVLAEAIAHRVRIRVER